MRGRRLSLRWWLALAFALVGSITALVVAEVFTGRAESAFRSRAQELATGTAVTAAESVRRNADTLGLVRATRAAAASSHLSLFVFDRSGRLVTSHGSRRASAENRDARATAVGTVLRGRRFVQSTEHGKTIVVGLPLHAGAGSALVAVASRPELRAELGIVHDQVVRAVLIAIAVGASVGLVISVLIAVRLRRIAGVAAAIDRGHLDTPLRPGFRDEVGELALTIDAMRRRLRNSFADLEEERNRLRRLLERLHEGVVAVDASARVQFANGVARRILGGELRPGDALPEPWPELRLRSLIAGLLEPSAPVAEARVSVDDARSYAIVGLPPAPGSTMSIIVLTDVTERERQERAEREFVANAAHELRTPLAAIGSAVEALQAGAKEVASDRDRLLGVVDRQASRLGRLARALLVLTRAQTREEPIKLEPVELRPLLTDVAAYVQPRDGVRVDVRCPAGLTALAQRDLVEQVVSNLAVNAAKHTEGGRITLGAERSREGVTVEVTDTGSGILPGVQDRIYDRFYVADGESRDGFGLGLAIVREAVRALGGLIEIESAPGSGTTARVTLAGER